MKKIGLLFFVIISMFSFTGCSDDTPDTPDDPTGPTEPVDPTPDNGLTLYFETYGGEEIEPITGIKEGEVITLPTPKRTGYTFDYWYTTPGLDFGTSLRKTVEVNEDMTVYAGWFALDYNIEFITNCGIKVKKINALTDEQITLPVIERGGYEFLGWYEDDELYTRTTMEPRDITLVAKWKKVDHTVTLDLDGGTLDSKYLTQTIEHNATSSLPTPIKAGYVFLGWYDNDKKYTSNTLITDDLTLIAKWDLVSNYEKTYNVKYELDGGTLLNAKTSYSVGKETILGTPTKTGYVFLGWYDNKNYTGLKVEKITSSDFGDKTYYACFVDTTKKLTVSFLDSKGNVVSTKEVLYGQKVTEEVIEAEAYFELSWYLENEIYDFNTPVTKDITLRAKWTILEDILHDLVPNRISDNIDLPNGLNTTIGDINITWLSSDKTILSSRGIVNPLREDTKVTLTAHISCGKSSFIHEVEVVVEAIEFRDLSKTTPVFAYLSSNMGSYTGMSGVSEQTIDVINYCFARVSNDGIVTMSELTKTSVVIEARKQGIRVLYSIGAYGRGDDDPTKCGNFSKAASTPEGRKKLIDSIIKIIVNNHFDGVDIDWEYPGSFPATGISPAEDRENYGLFMRELRKALDDLGPGYLLTAAIPGGDNPSSRYDMKMLDEVLDYMHIMSYDLHNSGRTCHHTALYSSNNTPYGSVDSSVKSFVKAGFPKSKIVIGAAFYGRVWKLSSNPSVPMGATNVVSGGGYETFTSIKQSYIGKSTVRTYWDSVSHAPYLYDSATKTFISYDNETSLIYKCKYLRDNDLAGIMFWDYGEDLTRSLVTAIGTALGKIEDESNVG